MGFYAEYEKLDTIADLDRLIDKTDTPTLKKLSDALQTVKEMTGLDMKQDFILRTISHVLQSRKNNIRIFRDIDNEGESYTVYNGSICLGSFLSDDVTLKKYIKESNFPIFKGIDNRTN